MRFLSNYVYLLLPGEHKINYQIMNIIMEICTVMTV